MTSQVDRDLAAMLATKVKQAYLHDIEDTLRTIESELKRFADGECSADSLSYTVRYEEQRLRMLSDTMNLALDKFLTRFTPPNATGPMRP